MALPTSWPEISRYIWNMKYRLHCEGETVDETIEDTWRRVANAVATAEKEPALWADGFYNDLLSGFRFLPGGRIIANAGSDRDSTTMFNCYVMGTIKDSIEGIFDVVKDAALTQKQGGGVGFDFSTIRPRGSYIDGVDSPASGPLSFMHVLDATCRTIMSAGQRRGAQMAIMRCDHPDIEAFITAKRDDQSLQMFNLSVGITDAFMKAVQEDAQWNLVFDGEVHNTVRATELWDTIMHSTYDHAEPGILMLDRVNEANNLRYCETICATNPCGEQPLPPYGACLLGSLNLTAFVEKPFEDDAAIDYDALDATTRLAVRFLDDVVELSNYPLDRQRDEAHAKRRMGLGITGLADMLIMLGLRYGAPKAVETAEKIMRTIAFAAYDASADLAAEKGSFPALDIDKHLDSPFLKQLPEKTRAKIRANGIRNSHLTSIAPTGTISLLAGNVSSGIEPVFAFHYVRRVRNGQEGETEEHEVMDFAYRAHCEMFGRSSDDKDLPDVFVPADQIAPKEHVDMQAAMQRYVDSSISKTINVPEDFPFEEFKDIYLYAYESGLKGCTTFRPNEHITGVLVKKKAKDSPKENGVVELTSRPEELRGTTYKVKTPLNKDAFYITINDIEEDGSYRPYEIFVNTKNLQHFSWIVSMTRLISAVFRRESDPSFLVEELRSIHDPNGGYFSNGEYVPSLPAEIGRLIASHLEKLGVKEGKDKTDGGGDETGTGSRLPICPMCNKPGLVIEEGCIKCRQCDYSKCG